MGKKQSRKEVDQRHSQMLKGVQVWLEDHPSVTPLHLGVFNEIVELVENHAKNGALVRVRIKNLGNGNSGQYKRWWSSDEIAELRQLYRDDNLAVPEIASRMKRSELAVKAMLARLEIRRKVPAAKYVKGSSYRNNGALEAARRIRERRMSAAREEQDRVDWAAD